LLRAGFIIQSAIGVTAVRARRRLREGVDELDAIIRDPWDRVTARPGPRCCRPSRRSRYKGTPMVIRRRQRGVVSPRPNQCTDVPGTLVGLAIADRVSNGIAVISLTGELDIVTADQAVKTVTDLIDGHRAPVLLDLACLTFCDAHGLSALLCMRKYALQSGQPLHIAAPSPQVRRIISITGLADELPVFQCGLVPP
jgi:anti-sigma B factor antagonist